MQSLMGAQRRLQSTIPAAVSVALAAASLAAAPSTTQPLASSAAESLAIRTHLPVEFAKVGNVLKVPGTYTSKAKRADALHKVQPILQNELKEFGRLAEIDPVYVVTAAVQRRVIAVTLAALGDSESTALIQSEVDSKDPDISINGQVDELRIKWSLANKEAAKEQLLADALEKLDRRFPTSDELTSASYSFGMQAATPELKNDLQAAAIGMTSKRSIRLRTIAKSSSVLAALANKPMTLAGTTPDGKPFTTADWKGKVILVDFWATWCGPCKAELPRVKKMYSDYHDKGLEVLGVSNDYKVSALTSFIADDQMPWPQLFNAEAAGDHEWNPITEKMGIPGIPMMFLIDKKGICRTTDGRPQMEKLIPQMLAESGEAVSMNVP